MVTSESNLNLRSGLCPCYISTREILVPNTGNVLNFCGLRLSQYLRGLLYRDRDVHNLHACMRCFFGIRVYMGTRNERTDSGRNSVVVQMRLSYIIPVIHFKFLSFFLCIISLCNLSEREAQSIHLQTFIIYVV